MAKNDIRRPVTRAGKKAAPAAPAGMTVEQARERARRFPDDPRVWLELAQLTIDTDTDQARAAAQKLAQLLPDDFNVRVILGKLESMAEQYDQAREHYEHALALQPDDFDMLCQVASLQLQVNKGTDQPLELIARALAQQPQNIHALYLKAYGLIQAHRYDEAIDLLQNELIPLDRDNAYYWNLLGQSYRDTGALKQAESAYLKSIALAEAAGNQAASIDAVSNRLTLMHYMPEHGAEEILRACKQWGALFTPDHAITRPQPANLAPARRIRVGLYANGFSAGPVSLMITPSLEHLRRFGFDIYLYANNPAYDHVAQRLIAAADSHAIVLQLSNEQFAQRIRDDGIDILVDLAGYNTSTRMSAMAMEPAPLLVKWVGGLINTTGLPAMDYLITDRVESPLGSDAFYTEKLIRMPDDYICYLPPPDMPDVGPLPARKNGYITLGCFNNPTKINETVLEKWAGIMQALPNSRLFLKGGAYDSAALRRRVQEFMQGYGIAAERLRLEGQSKHYQLLACYNDVDVALDPWPYSGGLTTCEALLMGVPVVTLPGPTFAGRHSATHVANAGLPELVAEDWDQYQSCVLALASDLDNMSTLRSSLRKILLDSPVCDGPRYARHLATALRAIWQRYCEGMPRASLVFTADGKPWFEDGDAPMDVVEPSSAAQMPAAGGKDFQFQLRGKIVTLDHGGAFVGTEISRNLSNLGGLITVAIDPAHALHGREQTLWGRLIQHHYHHVALGDGTPATLHLCEDNAYSGTLAPLPASRQLPALRQATGVRSTQVIPTTRLDDLTGLEKLDWMILDGANDNAAILRHAQRLLPHVLVVQAQTLLVEVFENQTDAAGLSTLLAPHGFELLRANRPHQVGRPQEMTKNAVFVPNAARIAGMNDDQRWKLAFLLHSAYQATELAYQVLLQTDRNVAERYLAANGAEPPLSGGSALAQTADRRVAPGPLISVIVTTYNIEKYIARCLDSVVGQTYQNLEIIVVDDASSDSTRSIIAQYAARDNRIVVVQFEQNSPGGVGTPANAGMQIAKGDYIGFVDGDDWCEPDMFESLYTAAAQADAQVAIGDFQLYEDEQGQYQEAYDKRAWRNPAIRLGERLTEPAARMTLLDFSPVPWRKLYRKDLIADPDMRFPEGDYFFEDNPFHWFCILKAQSFVCIDKVLCYHRTNRAGQTTASSAMRWLAMFRHHETMLAFLKRNHLYDAYGGKLISWIMSYSLSFFDWLEAPHHGLLSSEIHSMLSSHDPARVKMLAGAVPPDSKIALIAQQVLHA
ncbi:MAG: O-linked N-acetylglucosamine transferase family protein [Bordetella sp.]|uniref:O-linked N-acetylglucosamine transferase family protein n=1 Tax=Bordetella sp. TaxID=28081 RepID=UPI003F7C17D8